MLPEQLVQPINATHHLVKIGRELVGAKTIKPKGANDEVVNKEPNPTLKDGHQRKEYSVYVMTPLNVDIALVTVGDINILEDVVSSPKSGQSGF